MGKATGFMEYQRAQAPSRPLVEQIGDYAEFHGVYDQPTLQQQAARCMDCGIPFCHAGIVVEGASVGCPLGNVIPEINDLVYRGLYAEAYARLRRTHPFPEFTGRVCPALCEGSCTLGEHEPPVSIKEIEHYLDIFARERGVLAPRVPVVRTGRKVAVVGSGPAGLAAADALNRLGETVTVFERADRPGGLLMYGIPMMKLDKQIVLDRISILTQEGISFICNAEVGVTLKAESLLADFDAIVLAAGATRPLQTRAPGAHLDGVVAAMDFLTNATRGILDGEQAFDTKLSAAGRDVVILGAGDTGTDCVATALRQGAHSIVQFQRSAAPPDHRAADNPWPLWPRVQTTDYGHQEAIAVYGNDPREYGTSIKEIRAGRDGRVCSVITVGYDTSYRDNRKVLSERPGSERERTADMVIVAMGFAGPEPTLARALGLATDAAGSIELAAAGSYATSCPGVFVAGDMRRGQSLVVWALMEGRDAASEVHRYLEEQERFHNS
ncbi:MAG: glutamate synthase subunit beta [Coriobacteriales bacterium]|jgi:glutamate synthase (NADPH/NADH) small chain|nr:glutamate synthase subunit beta [Coriobacteriales bacterium]